VYYLDVKPAGLNTIVGTHKADLTTLAEARRAFCQRPDGSPAFGLWAALPGG
jgi:hypothetical protein